MKAGFIVSRYIVISAVYNVDKYIDHYFESITRQTLGFENFIYLIMVDDGSTDQSAARIKLWQKKFPHNITYLRKENGGQASARNFGLKYVEDRKVECEWITFIDPDDFVDLKYFEMVDLFIIQKGDPKLSLISCSIETYDEKTKTYKNNHPLKYRFENGSRSIPASDPGDFIQLTVNNAFFKANYLINSQLRMNEDIRPIFEDGHFVSLYLLNYPNINIGLVSNAKYYYRKRADRTSSLNTKKSHPGFYREVMVFGYLDLFDKAENRFGFIPDWLQRTVLYDLVCRIRYIIDDEGIIASLTKAKVSDYYRLMSEAITNIEERIIKGFELAKVNEFHKAILLSVFKKKDFIADSVYVTDYDDNRKLFKVSYYYTGQQPNESLTLNGKIVLAAYSKNISFSFQDQGEIYERVVWLPYHNQKLDSVFNVKINQVESKIHVHGSTAVTSITLEKMIKKLEQRLSINERVPFKHRLVKFFSQTLVARYLFKNAWLFIDRDTQADDNAEHLYKYIRNKYPAINAYFIIHKSSHDSRRLKKAGFKIIWFGTVKHWLALINARYVISSHVAQYATNYLNDAYYRDVLKYRIVFLQHGVIVHDMSNRLNNKKIDLFITSATSEYKSIVKDRTSYKFCEKEVVLTGLPRHDQLLKNVKREKIILVMPTWRRSLIGSGLGHSSERVFNEDVLNTEYVTRWINLLSDPAIKELVVEAHYKVVFFPHAYLKKYLSSFNVPVYVRVLHHGYGNSIQNLFQRASCMITDYSSVAFEMAYLKKPVLYYQFDHDFFFGGGHSFKKGYFDYEKDGFGPVCYDKPDIVKELKKIIARDCQPDEEYLYKMIEFFPHRDGNCCERVFQAIQNLEKPYLVADQALRNFS